MNKNFLGLLKEELNNYYNNIYESLGYEDAEQLKQANYDYENADYNDGSDMTNQQISEVATNYLNEQRDNHFSKVEFDDKGKFGVFRKKPGFSDEEISDAMNKANKKHFDRLKQRQNDEEEAEYNSLEYKQNDPEYMNTVRDRMEQQKQRNRENYIDPNQTRMFDEKEIWGAVNEAINKVVTDKQNDGWFN
jgi:hypothetical protein